MYASAMSSPFTAYLLGYSFPAILSTIIILLSATVLRSRGISRNRADQSQENPNQESDPNKEVSNPSFGTSFLNIGNQIRHHHVYYNEKLGVTTFILGLMILVFSKMFSLSGEEYNQSTLLAGDVIALFSAFFGIVFQWVFIHYSMRSLFRIVEFLFMMYLFSAILLTIV